MSLLLTKEVSPKKKEMDPYPSIAIISRTNKEDKYDTELVCCIEGEDKSETCNGLGLTFPVALCFFCNELDHDVQVLRKHGAIADIATTFFQLIVA